MPTRLLDLLSSLKVAVASLFLLMILVAWGTVHQVEYGLWDAQQRFFYSWVVPVFGWFPFPGGKLVLWVLFVNLLAATMRRISFNLRHTGLVLIHVGLLLLLAGGWVTHRYGTEAYLALVEGETSSAASSYRDWELAVWRDQGPARTVSAVDADALRTGTPLRFETPALSIRPVSFYRNARAFTSARAPEMPGGEPPEIVRLEPAPPGRDPEQDLPGLILDIPGTGEGETRIHLYGGSPAPARIATPDGEAFLQLRRKRYPLPLTVTLLDFKRSYHPNSSIPRSFSSDIRVNVKGVTREATVEMNQPFRYRDYTFYQASFADLGGGAEQSTFAVTRNAGRLIPYLSTAIVVAGLVIHFLRRLFKRQRRLREAAV